MLSLGYRLTDVPRWMNRSLAWHVVVCWFIWNEILLIYLIITDVLDWVHWQEGDYVDFYLSLGYRIIDLPTQIEFLTSWM